MAELSPEQLAKLTVLVVDPNKFTRGIVCDLLRQLGIRAVRQAESGAAALDEIRTFHPSVVLSEREVPDMDGLAITRWIRTHADSPNSRTPVIMVTFRTTKQELFEAREAGVTEFIVKPVTGQAIMLRLRAALLDPREFVRSETFVGPSRRRRPDEDFKGQERRR